MVSTLYRKCTRITTKRQTAHVTRYAWKSTIWTSFLRKGSLLERNWQAHQNPIADTLPNIFFVTTFRFYVLAKRTMLIPLLVSIRIVHVTLYTAYKLKKNANVIIVNKMFWIFRNYPLSFRSLWSREISYIRFTFLESL